MERQVSLLDSDAYRAPATTRKAHSKHGRCAPSATRADPSEAFSGVKSNATSRLLPAVRPSIRPDILVSGTQLPPDTQMMRGCNSYALPLGAS